MENYMNVEKQKLIIEYLLSSVDTFAVCQSIIKPEYFDPEFRNSVFLIKEYFGSYNTTPALEIINAETGLKFEQKQVTPDKIEYVTSEIEQFCRRRALERAVLASPKWINEGDYASLENAIRDAILVSLHKDLGLRYFEDPEARLLKMLELGPVISTGWKEVDEVLFGGISRKELLLVSANSGGGKSITLANLAFNVAAQGLTCLYLSLELSEEVIAQRFDTMYTGISRKVWKDHIHEIVARLQIEKDRNGVIDIKQMKSGTKAMDINAFLREYYLRYGCMPDLLIVDYLDKMHPNEKNINLSDVWTKDKLCSEQIRDLGVEYNMAVATASQLNRDAIKDVGKGQQHNHAHIAGGISKINESDVYWSILMTDPMKAAGECIFHFQKTRNSDGCGSNVLMKWDGKFLRIIDRETTPSLQIKTSTKTTQPSNGLLDLMQGLQTI